MSRPTPKTWRTRLAEAARRKRFTWADRDRADEWATCAVGEAQQRYPTVIETDCYNGPVDPDLSKLGVVFDACVWKHDYRLASEHYRAIQRRVAQLRAQAKRRKGS